ncbi:hypothetical protein CsSME_00042938 [Camellia sinensis var. sinensis]
MDSEGFVDDAQDLRLWPNKIELAFIQLMVEEVKQDPFRIGDELYNQFKVRYMQAYNTFVKVKNHTGFSWDDQRKMVVALDNVWDQYVKAHPKAKVFRKKGLDRIDLLDVLFVNSQATGALAHDPQPFDEEMDIQSAFFGVGINLNTDFMPVGDDIERDDDPKVGRSSGNDGGRKGAHLDLAFDTWINKIVEASQAEKKQYSIDACMDYSVCESFRDEATRIMFMKMHWVRKLA